MLRAVLSDSSFLTCNRLSTNQPATLFVYHLCNVIEYTSRHKYLNGEHPGPVRVVGLPFRDRCGRAYMLVSVAAAAPRGLNGAWDDRRGSWGFTEGGVWEQALSTLKHTW